MTRNELLNLFLNGGLGTVVDDQLFRMRFKLFDDDGNPLNIEELISEGTPHATNSDADIQGLKSALLDMNRELKRYAEVAESLNFMRRELEARDKLVVEKQKLLRCIGYYVLRLVNLDTGDALMEFKFKQEGADANDTPRRSQPVQQSTPDHNRKTLDEELKALKAAMSELQKENGELKQSLNLMRVLIAQAVGAADTNATAIKTLDTKGDEILNALKNSSAMTAPNSVRSIVSKSNAIEPSKRSTITKRSSSAFNVRSTISNVSSEINRMRSMN